MTASNVYLFDVENTLLDIVAAPLADIAPEKIDDLLNYGAASGQAMRCISKGSSL